jgi:hypothetical protein
VSMMAHLFLLLFVNHCFAKLFGHIV